MGRQKNGDYFTRHHFTFALWLLKVAEAAEEFELLDFEEGVEDFELAFLELELVLGAGAFFAFGLGDGAGIGGLLGGDGGAGGLLVGKISGGGAFFGFDDLEVLEVGGLLLGAGFGGGGLLLGFDGVFSGLFFGVLASVIGIRFFTPVAPVFVFGGFFGFVFFGGFDSWTPESLGGGVQFFKRNAGDAIVCHDADLDGSAAHDVADHAL